MEQQPRVFTSEESFDLVSKSIGSFASNRVDRAYIPSPSRQDSALHMSPVNMQKDAPMRTYVTSSIHAPELPNTAHIAQDAGQFHKLDKKLESSGSASATKNIIVLTFVAIGSTYTLYKLWTEYLSSSMQSYKNCADVAKWISKNSLLKFIREFSASQAIKYENEVTILGYDACKYHAAQQEQAQIKQGGSIFQAHEDLKKSVKECAELWNIEAIIPVTTAHTFAPTSQETSITTDEQSEQKLSGAQRQYKTDL